MNLETRIQSFAQLGELLGQIAGEESLPFTITNPWFTPREIRRALRSWSTLITAGNLNKWLAPYPSLDQTPVRNIQVIASGNIPLVGFHDFLSVLITGNRYIGKLSSRDNQLLPAIADLLTGINPDWKNRITLTGEPAPFDAVIATGSTNTSRYFQRTYRSVPSIIRKNRTSVAVLTGRESRHEYDGLCADILNFYGLGCRSVSHVFMPDGLSPEPLSEALSAFGDWEPNPLLSDNLKYQKALLTMQKTPFRDTGKVILAENHAVHSPIGVVYFSFYADELEVGSLLSALSHELQCVVGNGQVRFGYAQQPELWDYADQVDTIGFLQSLNP